MLTEGHESKDGPSLLNESIPRFCPAIVSILLRVAASKGITLCLGPLGDFAISRTWKLQIIPLLSYLPLPNGGGLWKMV